MDDLYEQLLKFTDSAVQKLAEQEQLIAQLKTRIDDFEKKLHILMEEYRNRK